MGDVIEGQFITRLDLPSEKVLRAALEADLKSVVVIGYDQDGDEYFSSGIADGGKVNYLLDRCKKVLLDAWDTPEA